MYTWPPFYEMQPLLRASHGSRAEAWTPVEHLPLPSRPALCLRRCTSRDPEKSEVRMPYRGRRRGWGGRGGALSGRASDVAVATFVPRGETERRLQNQWPQTIFRPLEVGEDGSEIGQLDSRAGEHWDWQWDGHGGESGTPRSTD